MTYPIDALVRDDDAGARAVRTTLNLVRLVSEFDADSIAAVDMRCGDEPGRLELSICVSGPIADDLAEADLASALGEGVFLGAPRNEESRGFDVDSAFELVRIPVDPMVHPVSDDRSDPEWLLRRDEAEGAGFAAPIPHDDSGESLLAAMARTGRRVWVRTILGSADPLAALMVIDDLSSMMHRQSVAEYAKVPVVARTFVVAEGGVPVAVRAALRQRGSGLHLVPRAVEEATLAWSDPHRALQSAAVAETHAVAITRVPAAGSLRSLGVPTRPSPVPPRALDPMPPTPSVPIRLGWATDAFGGKVSAELDVSDLLRHVFIEGRSGSGKTTLLAQLFWSLTQSGHQVLWLDPHGDGASRAAAYSSTTKDVTTHYIRHGDREHPIRLNPLAQEDGEARERVLSELLDLIQAMLDPNHEGMVGERFKRTFTVIAHAAFEVFRARTSLTDVVALSLTKDSLRVLARAARRSSKDAAVRLESEILSLGDKEFADLISWFTSRLQPFLRTPALREILGTGEDAVDVLKVINCGDNLIVDLASLDLGEDVARVLGALWLLKVRQAMGRRSGRRPIVLLVDEAHLYTFGALPGMLAEARKFGIGIVVATQAADNLTPRLARAIEANVGSSISLRTGINAAFAASERLGGWPTVQLTRLEDLTAAASLSRGGVPTTAFTLHVDHFDVVAEAGWDVASVTAAADAVAQATQNELWAPFAGRPVLDDATVVASVALAIEPEPRGETRSSLSSARTRSALDAWAHRAQQQHEPANADASPA